MKATNHKISVGNKVMIPLVKTEGVPWTQSSIILKAVPKQDHLFVVNISEDGNSVELHTRPDSDMGEFFSIHDIETYRPEKRIQHLIQILKLIKKEKRHIKINKLSLKTAEIQLRLF